MSLSFNYKKTDPNAIAPSKAHPTDSGFDLHLIKKVKELTTNVTLYDTGISVEPPPGYYFELVGRSSISKSGYMLANNVGIIDESYRGSIMAALIKVDPDAAPLEFPCRLVQLIPRQLVLMNPNEISELTETERGAGGFGSSGR
jgi:dUTP pyrophosphatase